jgi:antirestriction protein ArdC
VYPPKIIQTAGQMPKKVARAGAAVMNNTQIYAAITEKIIANLETAGSWKKLWQIPSPVSLNGHYYRGINRLILSSDPFKSRVYGTFQQIRANGGKVRKGEKATVVVFWKSSIHTDEVTKEQKRMFLLRYFHIFNTEQADFDQQGLDKIAQLQNFVEERHTESHVDAEQIITCYRNKPEIIFSDKDDRAYYSPIADMISIPKMKYFANPSDFFGTLYHECIHSVGHPKRLNRFDLISNRFGDEPYSKEELVAELGASYLSEIAHLELNIRNSAAYISGWASKLRDNQKWILWAASRAEKAADYILGINSEEQVLADSSEEEILEPAIASV